MDNRITQIQCLNCGAPAKFDIIHQNYLCNYCGSKVEIGEAQKQKQGFRKIRGEYLKNTLKQYSLFETNCDGCGAKIVFEENEALSTCPFCGKSLVRSKYLQADDMPECVIPFALKENEARNCLENWCRKNRTKPEAGKLLSVIDELKGFYLPYELVEGPINMSASRMDGNRTYYCEGYIADEFVNRSSQLDNLLLDGMEPYDLDSLCEFDFGYVAGQRVKISDIDDKVLEERVKKEAETAYRPSIRKVLETQAVEVDAGAGSTIRLPVLLPVYYICKDELMAAVSGQTGKVSVRAIKPSHYYFLPWWLKAIIMTIVFSLLAYGAFTFFGMEKTMSFLISGILSFFFIIVLLCLYSDTTRNSFSVESGRKIYTSDGPSFKREKGQLVLNDEILNRKVEEPVFFEKLDGELKPVALKFTTPLRVIRMILLCIVALFLPVINALLINGFDFNRLNLGGSAVWFCIFVPVVPIYLLKFGIVELHDKPWIYTIDENGKKKRYRKKLEFKFGWPTVGNILRALFIPPVSLAVWFGILSYVTMVYLTAFGF